jgi:hypothetical protein
MKRFFTLAILLVSLTSQAQLIADPALEQITFTDLAGNEIVDTFPLGNVVKLNIPIKNLHPDNGLPGGTCKIKVGLGSKLILAPGFDLSTVISSQYFEWTAANVGGQIQLTGELKNNLPANYVATAIFDVQGSVLEFSTVTANFLVSNHNAPVVLSDNDPSNNNSFRLYKIIPPITTPVDFRNLFASVSNCEMQVKFLTENELNVARYEIEVSNNATDFIIVKNLVARSLNVYEANFAMLANLRADNVFVRVKSIDIDGTFKYSETKRINNTCANRNVAFSLYPNPVYYSQSSIVHIKANTLLNGNYTMQLIDATGRQVHQKILAANNSATISTAMPVLAKGMYWLKLVDSDGISLTTMKLQIQ